MRDNVKPFVLGILTLFPLAFLYYFSYKIPFDLGRIFYPAPLYGKYIFLYFVCGIASLLLFALTINNLKNTDIFSKLFDRLSDLSDRNWIVITSVLAIIIPVCIRFFILKGAPITDDEFAYQFSAELLKAGKLYGIPHDEFKHFFDHLFLINDKKVYSQYFLGWPALMVPGLWLKIPGYINALYAGLTVPALFLSAKKLTNSGWAKLTTIIYLTSPMIMIAASTKMAHTTCLMTLTWMFLFFLKTLNNENSKPIDHALFSIFFCIAFFIRPQAALALSFPFLFIWLYKIFTQKYKVKKFLACIIPAIVFAGLFLQVNKVQTGHYFTPAYTNVFKYRNTKLIYPIKSRLKHANLALNPKIGWIETKAAIIRLNFASFGWPLSFLFLFFAGWKRRGWTPWVGLLSYFIFQFFCYDPGIDTFGPTHYFETVLLLLLLTATGAENLTKMLGKRNINNIVFPIILFLVVLSLIFYTPKRFTALYRIQKDINWIPNIIKKYQIHNAVVFVKHQALLNCMNYPTRHFRFWQIDYDYKLKNEVLYLHHINLKKDKAAMAMFPGRKAYVLTAKTRCKPQLTKIT